MRKMAFVAVHSYKVLFMCTELLIHALAGNAVVSLVTSGFAVNLSCFFFFKTILVI